MLGERLGKVRVWVEGVERGEREWGGRVRMRLRILAGMLVGLLVLIVLLYIVDAGGGGGDGRLRASSVIFGGGAGAGAGGDVMRKRWNSMNLGAAERAISSSSRGKKEDGSSRGSGSSSSSSTAQNSVSITPSVKWQEVARGDHDDEDQRLRVFDEL